MIFNYQSIIILIALWGYMPAHILAEPSIQELEQWFNNDRPEPSSKSSDDKLQFLSTANKKALHSKNTIIISKSSLKTGWVLLAQCYKNLDPVPDMEVSYQYKNIRKLKIKSIGNIERAYVKEKSVQLNNVEKDARLCIQAEVGILYKNRDGSFRLVNGPYHRQFLDSFFPYHLTMNINYPASSLELIAHRPKQQAGFIVNKNPGVISFDTYFTGKLFTEFIFKEK